MTKIIDIRRAGNNVRLTIECLNGKTFINLQLHLNNPPGPAYVAVHNTAVQVDLPKPYYFEN